MTWLSSLGSCVVSGLQMVGKSVEIMSSGRIAGYVQDACADMFNKILPISPGGSVLWGRAVWLQQQGTGQCISLLPGQADRLLQIRNLPLDDSVRQAR